MNEIDGDIKVSQVAERKGAIVPGERIAINDGVGK